MLLMKLSVAIICKNEEKLIQRAIVSVQAADEIVILDTGSTDSTESVVAALNLPQVKFIKDSYVWKDDFADARNAAMDCCSGDWCLLLDADDFMAADSIPEIRAAIAAMPSARTIDCKILHEKSPDFYFYPKLIRLNAGVRMVGACHEVTSVRDAGPHAGTMILGYSENHQNDTGRVLRIMGQMYAADPTNSRTLYYLGREHYYRKDDAKAIPLLEACVKCSTFLAERADAYLYLARIFWRNQRGCDARAACMNALIINANFREALLFMATLSFEHNAVRWREFAEHATNEHVLFVRNPP